MKRRLGVRKCEHRSAKIGTLKAGCSACVVFRCGKYSTYCTPHTPSEWNLPIVGTPDKLGRDNSRQCSMCMAAGENA